MRSDWLNLSMRQGSCKPELGRGWYDLYVFVANSSVPGGQKWAVVGSLLPPPCLLKNCHSKCIIFETISPDPIARLKCCTRPLENRDTGREQASGSTLAAAVAAVKHFSLPSCCCFWPLKSFSSKVGAQSC